MSAANLISSTRSAIQRDPKKAVVLGVLSMVLLSIWFFRMSKGPESASAAAKPATPAAAPALKTTAEAPANKRVVRTLSGQSRLVSVWRDRPIPHVSRNLFTASLLSPPKQPVTEIRLPSEADGRFWRQLEGSLAARADWAKRRQTAIDAALADAAMLSLQSLMVSGSPSALVNGELVREGDIIELPLNRRLRVTAIEADRLVVSRFLDRGEVTIAIHIDGRPPLLLPNRRPSS